MLPNHLSARFVDQGELGRGGMGVVRRALDLEIDRTVALKLAHEELSESELRRFGDEARITARLAHPNVVPIYDIFRDDGGRPNAFAMKLIEGETLAAVLARRAMTSSSDLQLSEILPVFLDVCDAVAFAHSRGVVHRDLNPRNVLVGDYGEVYVSDWGLAASLDDLRSGMVGFAAGISGTPAYMSPEQLSTRRERIDERSDVFGLGAMLYETLTGQPPFPGQTIGEIIAQASRGRVTPPEQLREDLALPSELCSIVCEALAIDPGSRPGSVAALRARVDEFFRRGGWFPAAHFAPQALVVRQGDLDDTAYIVLEGRCEIYRGEGNARRVIREVGPGDVFGEIALFTNAPRTATVRALTEVRVLVVSRATLEHELDRGTWMRAFVRAAGERYLELDRAQAQRDLSDAG